MSRRRVDHSVVVIVGATSGVGRATAQSLAARGAHLVLVGHTVGHVTVTADDCREVAARGGYADTTIVGVVADNADPVDLERIATTTVERFGHIDTWINMAALLVIGRLTDQSVDDIRRLVDTNVVGTALASRAALAQFERQDGGVLINVSSWLGVVPNPLVPTYTMSKFAVRGLTLSLREAARATPVRVCLVIPPAIDTPMFARAVNRSGRVARAIPPAVSPERVAATVIRSVRRPRRQRTTGVSGSFLTAAHGLAPRLAERAVAAYAGRLVLTKRPLAAPEASPRPTRTSGDWRNGRVRRKLGDAFGRTLARR